MTQELLSHRRQVEQDLSYLRGLAEQARATPPAGGPFLLWWGCVLVAAYALHGAILQGWTSALRPQHLGLMWLIVVSVGWLGHAWLGMRQKATTQTTASVMVQRGWQWGGIVITLIGVSANARAALGQLSYDLFPMYSLMCLALYSVVLGLVTAAQGRAFFHRCALVGTGVSLALVWLLGTPAFYPVIALGFVATAIVPGLLMIRTAQAE
jgi:hypothetical protein